MRSLHLAAQGLLVVVLLLAAGQAKAQVKTVAAAPAKAKPTQKTVTAETKSAAAPPAQPKRRGLFGLRQDSAQGVLY